MKRETQIVWTDSNGETLLRKVKTGEWSVIPSTVDAFRMAELRDAIIDALTPPPAEQEVK